MITILRNKAIGSVTEFRNMPGFDKTKFGNFGKPQTFGYYTSISSAMLIKRFSSLAVIKSDSNTGDECPIWSFPLFVNDYNLCSGTDYFYADPTTLFEIDIAPNSDDLCNRLTILFNDRSMDGLFAASEAKHLHKLELGMYFGDLFQKDNNGMEICNPIENIFGVLCDLGLKEESDQLMQHIFFDNRKISYDDACDIIWESMAKSGYPKGTIIKTCF